MKTAVIGAGTWGTALAILLDHNGHETILHAHREEAAEEMNRTHRHPHLEGAVLPETVPVTTDLKRACCDRDIIVLACPSIHVREMARKMAPHIRANQILVSVSKGIEEDTLKTMTDIIEEEIPQADTAVLSGPSHAEEVSRFLPTTIVVGAHSEKTAKLIQNAFMSDCFRVYISSDMQGIEVGAALKNVVALAAGMADGLGYGDNTKAALITRGMAEICRLGTAMGSEAETFYGLSGIGDLIVTCASMHSRNRRAGILMGKGKSAEEAMEAVGQVVEGVYAARSGLKLSQKFDQQMPMIEEINRILFENKSPSDAVNDLMMRDRRAENTKLKF